MTMLRLIHMVYFEFDMNILMQQKTEQLMNGFVYIFFFLTGST
jgi:hypothetical protein